MSHQQRLRTAAAVLVTVAASGLLALGSPAPSGAAACSGSSGVTVVVEPGGLGGATSVGCVSGGGGRNAARLLGDAGHSLTYVQRFPGFVCRIDGAPADDPCVNTPPADAYWGLWWSDGRSGRWTYSSLGAGSLDIPDGGYVAMVWDGSTGTVRPQTGAPAHPTPSPTPTPTKKPPTQAPTPSADPTSDPPSGGTPTSAGTGGGTPSPTTTKKPKPSKSQSADETTASPSSDDEQTEAAGPVDVPAGGLPAGDGGLPVWVAPVVVALLLVGAGAVAAARRRTRP